MSPQRAISIDPAIWPKLSGLLDEWLDRDADLRSPELQALWMESLSPRYDDVLPLLRDMLAADAQCGSALNTLPSLSSPGELSSGFAANTAIGPWRLIQELGHGGMGVVWLAERADGSLRRPVALKLPFGWLHAGLLERFDRERDILARLTHPLIARLYDAGIAAGGQPWLALEYVQGETIVAHCDREGHGIRTRLKLFLEVLRAVHFAHTNLVVHRDLKPTNILVTGDGEVRLLDFGIAKLLTGGEAEDSELTRAGGRALTPDYASPEQLTGTPVTTASDVYSLGVLLYELLTGQKPYRLQRDTPGGLEAAILTAEPVRPSQVGGATSKKLASLLKGDLDTIILKALAKEPPQRYATADAFAQDLERYLKGDPILARPESVVYRARKFAGRHKVGVAASAAILVALGGGLGAALWQTHLARIQTRTAEAVESFVLDMFRANGSANPDPVKARQTTARELLDIGSARIQTQLKDAPEARLRAVELLSNLYADLALTSKSVELRKIQIELVKSIYGPDHPLVAKALAELANNIAGSSMEKSRMSLVDEGTRILDRTRDYTSMTRGDLYMAASNEYYATNLPSSLEFSQKAASVYRLHGPSQALADALLAEGVEQRDLGHYPQALAALSESAATAEQVQGEAKGSLAIIYLELGETHRRLFELAEAEKSYRLALDKAIAFRGPEHRDVVHIKAFLGPMLMQAGRIEEGRRLLDEALDLGLRIKGPDDLVDTGMALETLGRALLAYGDTEKAIARLSQLIDMHRRAQRTQSFVYAARLDARASAEIELGAYAKAEADLAEASAVWEKAGGLTSGFGSYDFAPRAGLLLAKHRAQDAADLLDGFAAKADGPGVMTRAGMEYMIARAETALALSRFEDARKLAAEARVKIEINTSRDYLKLLECRVLLLEGRALLGADRPAQAQPLLERAATLGSAVYDPGRSRAFAAIHRSLEESLARSGK